ncbi:MAG: (4Fe-4S)-binding protein [Anaerolineae bacterium]|nr:(4Fe-4S)-binding protein [Anaerolineae bacterium]
MPPKSRRRNYTAKDIHVSYDIRRCIHAAECVRGLPEVFDTEKRPWIQADNAPADEVAEIVMRCPTGALRFERQDDGLAEPVPGRTTIHPVKNGPLYLHGDLTITTSEGEVLKDTRMALCRCGASNNKPFCDDSHYRIGFKADSW